MVVLLLLLAFTASAQVPADVNQDVAARINEYIDALVKTGKFNGSLLVARDGRVVVSKSYGMSNFELDVPNAFTRNANGEVVEMTLRLNGREFHARKIN